MKPINTRIHGVLDYLVGVLLIIAPAQLGLTQGPEKWVPFALGVAAIIYSLLTDYELGALRLLPFRGHLMIDAFHGVLLALSPWLFSFAEQVYLPHLLMGLAELAVVVLSQSQPSTASPRVRVRAR